MRKELLRISHVSLERDGEQLLDNLEFQMFAGEIFGLVARNRKGQKEMVDLICRNDPITLGSVWYDGKIVKECSRCHNENTYTVPSRNINSKNSSCTNYFSKTSKE